MPNLITNCAVLSRVLRDVMAAGPCQPEAFPAVSDAANVTLANACAFRFEAIPPHVAPFSCNVWDECSRTSVRPAADGVHSASPDSVVEEIIRSCLRSMTHEPSLRAAVHVTAP